MDAARTVRLPNQRAIHKRTGKTSYLAEHANAQEHWQSDLKPNRWTIKLLDLFVRSLPAIAVIGYERDLHRRRMNLLAARSFSSASRIEGDRNKLSGLFRPVHSD